MPDSSNWLETEKKVCIILHKVKDWDYILSRTDSVLINKLTNELQRWFTFQRSP